MRGKVISGKKSINEGLNTPQGGDNEVTYFQAMNAFNEGNRIISPICEYRGRTIIWRFP